MSKFLVASAAAALFAAVANAQSAPDWKLIPAKCATDCAKTVEASYLCNQQYSIGTLVYGCFCKDYPSDADACATCLTSNDAAALATLLTGTKTDCAAQTKACAFECAFATCDVPNDPQSVCQCDAGYLANIYNCASCNTANRNTAGTQLDDFKSLNESCGNQNFTGAFQNYNTWLPSPTGADSYAAPTLTATGGGDAATGTFAAATDKAAATDAAGAATSGAPAATSAGAAATSGGAAATSGGAAASAGTGSAVVPSGGSKTSGAAGAASSTAGSGALNVVAPAGVAAGAALLAVLL